MKEVQSERQAVGVGLARRTGISIIGAGNWGSSLARALAASTIPLLEVVVRERGSLGEAGRGEAAMVTAAEALYDAEILWICVPDAKIAGVAEEIAARRGDLRGQIVLHSSGALTIKVLEAARLAGAEVAGIAPIYSFPTREPVGLAGVLFAVETAAEYETDHGATGGPGLWPRLAALVRELGGEPLRVPSEKKVLYHAAATMASPLVVSALEAAVATAKLAGLSSREAEAVVGVLATASVRNYFEKGKERSFSGAFARGDVATVELHLQALLEHPILHGVYEALARNAVASLPVRNRGELEQVLQSARRDEPGVRD